MNKEEIEEIETLEIDFNDTDELELALEVSSKKAIYLIDDLIKHLFELQQKNQKYKEVIDKAIECINKYESIKAYYEYIDEDGYDEYNCDEDFKKTLLDILKKEDN